MGSLYDTMMNGLKVAEAGREAGKQTKLAQLAAQAYATPREQRQTLLGQVAALDPDAASRLETTFGNRDKSAHERIVERAKLIASADPSMRPQLYAGMAQMAAEAGLPQVPDQWDEKMLGHMQALAGASGAEEYTLSPGAARYRGNQLIASQPFAPEKPDFTWDSDRGVWIPKPTMGAMPAPQLGVGADVMGSTFDSAIGPLLSREGGYVANDAGAGPTNFGINSRANPDVNVASLDANAARDIYRQRYWDAIDADHLPPAIRNAAFDAAVNMGPEVAKQLVQQSGGDPQKFAALRQQRYDGLVAKNPQKYGQYADSWANRNRETAGLAAIPVAGIGPKPKTDESFGQPVTVNDPRTGKPALVQIGNRGTVRPVQGYAPAATAANAGRNASAAAASPIKIAQVNNVDRGIERIDKALNGLSGKYVDTGPVDQFLVGNTSAGKELKAAVGQIQESLLALTRVPGIGAQSDLEARIAGLKFPSLDMPPEVNRRTLANLRAFVKDLKTALQGASPAAPPNAPAAPRGNDPLGLR